MRPSATPPPAPTPQAAAFFRVEGVLVGRTVLGQTAYLAANAAGFRERALRTGAVALAVPLYAFLGSTNRSFANRAAFAATRHMREDRVVALGEEYWEVVLRPALQERGLELIREARRAGQRIVLLSDGLASVIERLAAHVGADEFVCNRLEFVDGCSTGRLLGPVVGGHDGGRVARDVAERRGFKISDCVAYGVHGPDSLLLATVGHPCAVNPDFVLRGAARDAGWPTLDYT